MQDDGKNLGLSARVSFVGGTLLVDGAAAESRGTVWDDRTGTFRAPAYLFHEILAHVEKRGAKLEGDLRENWPAEPRAVDSLCLRSYQVEALDAWTRRSRRGVLALPTGAGKTRIAIAAILACGVPAIVLCPTRALLAMWASELSAVLGERIGIVGDGERTVERVTVMTFESAYRRLDGLGDRFGLLIVDEVHHFASGARAEALEACAAPFRLGLSATAPQSGSEGARRLAELVGPVVVEVSVAELAGTHLANLSIMRIPVELDVEERIYYEKLTRRLAWMRRVFFAKNRGASYEAMLHGVGSTPEGRAALRDYAEAVQLACFPKAKRSVISSLLERHRNERTIVFTARVEDAYCIAETDLIPVITAEVSTRERERILTKFRDGRLRAMVSARVLNEGIDVPDARVAIVVSGSLGAREHVQRIGRVLRPAPGKQALVYELVTQRTVDERQAKSRGARTKAVLTTSKKEIQSQSQSQSKEEGAAHASHV
jgi:superfamily II DNA or RNA helicase